MAEQLVNEFTVNRPIDEAWAVITDVERIAPCMPGAQLTEIEGDTYRGTVAVHFYWPHPDDCNELEHQPRRVSRAIAARCLRTARRDGVLVEAGADGSYCIHVHPGEWGAWLPREGARS